MISTVETVDYGDIPSNFNEDEMRKYLMMESKIVLPQKRRDSFEEMYNREHEKVVANKPVLAETVSINSNAKTLTLPNSVGKDNSFIDLKLINAGSTSIISENKEFEFRKQTQNESQNKESILSKQILMKKRTEQTKDSFGRLVIKQLPFQFKTHCKCHFFVEISKITDNSNIQHIIIHFFKHLTVAQFCEFFRGEFEKGKYSNFDLQLYVADEDGDLDDCFPQPDISKQLASLGIKHFYMRFNEINEKHKESTVTNDTFNEEEYVKDDQYDNQTPDTEEPQNKCCCIL